EPVVEPSKDGVRADLGTLLVSIRERVTDGGGAVPVRFESAPPEVSDAAAAETAQEVRSMLAAPVALSVEGHPIGALSPQRMAPLLRFEAADGRLVALLDQERLARTLDPAVAPFKERAVNARFEVDGARASVVPSQEGVGLDTKQAVVAITTAAHSSGER